VSAPEELLERIRLRLDESFVGIGEVVAELLPSDVADLVNRLTRQEAAAVMSMLAVPRAVEVFDQPTLNRRSGILEQMDPTRSAQILEGLAADCAADGRYEFLLVAPPLPVTRGVGTPINPYAIK
jgi:Mg/Co/Ni transporter MgtE